MLLAAMFFVLLACLVDLGAATLPHPEVATPFYPTIVNYEDLLAGSPEDFLAALASVGMVGISKVPGFEDLRRDVLRDGHQCLQSLSEDVAREHNFEDGTKRRTLAFTTTDEDFDIMKESELCSSLRSKQVRFRERVAEVSRAFARAVDMAIEVKDAPLLDSEMEEPYNDIQDIFERGEHLEHLHSYHLPREQAQISQHITMDFHTDQGLCIAFTPALLVRDDMTVTGGDRVTAGRFQVQLRDGKKVDVDFSDAELVFMLGDGVNQYVNRKKSRGPDLRAVPHALSMPLHATNEWRVWYGRMFMAPKDSILEEHDITNGEIRDLMTKAWVTEDKALQTHLSLGCSAGLQARELNEADEAPPCSTGARRRCTGGCANNQKQCWWRCMNFTDVKSTCEAQDMTWNCTNTRDEISNGKHHGAYDLRCTAKDNMQLVRSNCDASFPRLNVDKPSTCTYAGFEEFLTGLTWPGNEGRNNLKEDENGNPEVVFKWNSAVDGTISAVMAFNGKVSWLSLGLENLAEDSGKYGMQGASVIFGISNQDTEFPDHTGTVQEYKIHDTSSRFDHWKTPLANPAITDSSMIEQNCYTAMRFTTESIYGQKLNVTGENRLIWAIRASTHMQVGKDSYHEGCLGTERTRYRGGGRKTPWIVDWSTGKTPGTNEKDATSMARSIIVSATTFLTLLTCMEVL